MPENTALKPIGPGDHVFLVDGSSFVFRAYFQSINQDAKYNYRSDGLPTGAIRLFSTKLYQFILDGAVGTKPTHLAILFDKSEDTFRKEIYADYKANRQAPDEDLAVQFPYVRRLIEAMAIRCFADERYEADDILATLAKVLSASGHHVVLVTGDKDLMQCVTETVTLYDPIRDLRVGIPQVIEKFGVPPSAVVDVQGLMGDSVDNIPGVPKVGPKTAAKWLTQHGTLEAVIANAADVPGVVGENLRAALEWLPQGKRLLTVRTDCKLELKPSEYVQRQIRVTPYPTEPVGWIIEQVGPDVCLFSSDWPQVEGGRNPIKRFEASLERVSEAQRQRFYCDNFVDLMGRGLPAAA